jgi:hypothetical protein
VKLALSLTDNSDVSAEQFHGKGKEWQNLHRDNLVCLACGAPASFRIVSAKRRPTFSARHEQDCLLASRPWSAFKYLQ